MVAPLPSASLILMLLRPASITKINDLSLIQERLFSRTCIFFIRHSYILTSIYASIRLKKDAFHIHETISARPSASNLSRSQKLHLVHLLLPNRYSSARFCHNFRRHRVRHCICHVPFPRKSHHFMGIPSYDLGRLRTEPVHTGGSHMGQRGDSDRIR